MNRDSGLRFNTMPVIATRFGRKRGTLECGLHDVACVANVIGEGEGRAPNSLMFSCFPRSPSLSRCILRVIVLSNQNGVAFEAFANGCP